MPELPEVECLRLQWVEWLRSPGTLTVEDDALLPPEVQIELSSSLQEAPKPVIRRKGKLLETQFPSGTCWIQHLGMTGKWVERPLKNAEKARARLKIGKRLLLFQDVRRFGKWFGPAEKVREESGWNQLGPDALTMQHEALSALMKQRRRKSQSARSSWTSTSSQGSATSLRQRPCSKLDCTQLEDPYPPGPGDGSLVCGPHHGDEAFHLETAERKLHIKASGEPRIRFECMDERAFLAFNAIPSLVELSSVGAPLSFCLSCQPKNRPLDTESDNSEKKEAGRFDLSRIPGLGNTCMLKHGGGHDRNY